MTIIRNPILYICSFVEIQFLYPLAFVAPMHISIADNLKKQFHAACALRGLKMSQVVAELIEQWLKANKASPSGEPKSQSDYQLRT
jgi:hypothetical protein